MRNARCTECALHQSAKTVCIDGDGPADVDILIVGQNPGAQEDRHGKPFIGPSGKVLKAQLAKAGFDPGRIRYTNAVRCLTPNNREPSAKEVKACLPYLQAEIERIKPKYIVPVGGVATKAVAKEAKISTAHGKFIERDGRVIMPTYHVAATFRDPSKLTAIRQDFERLKRYVDGTYGKTQYAFQYHVIKAKAELPYFWKEFETAQEWAYDTETNGLFIQKPDFLVRCVSIALPTRAWVIPLEMPGSIYQGDFNAQQAFFRVLERKARDKWAVTFHGKFDSGAIHRVYGVRLPYHFDAMLAHYVLDENQDHDLKYVSRIELDCPEYDLPKELKLSDKPKWLELMQQLENREKYWKYNGQDSWNTLHLGYKFSARLNRDVALRRLFYSLMMPSSHALQNIEAEGMPLGQDKYAAVEARTRLEREAALVVLRKYADINWDSRDQVAEVLYTQLKLPVRMKTPTGLPAVSEEAIVDLKGKHPIINELLEYRRIDKLLGTYLEGWKKDNVIGNRIFFSYKQTGTVTGRFSSRLHQIPTDGDIRSIISGVEM